MKYWLHRITGGENANAYVHPLLENGFISIGWKGLSNENNKDQIKNRGWQAVNTIMTNYGWELGRSRYCLSRFISDMRKGDIVIVPFPGCFSIYEIEDDIVYSNESFYPELFLDVNGILASKKEGDGYFTFINNQGNEIDLGFYRRVKPRLLGLSRYNGIDPALYSKMKTLMTNIEITNVGYAIDKLLDKKAQDTDIKITPSVKNTQELLNMELSIPLYQRPYVWTTDNIEQMLSDIKKSMDQGKESYRLGSIILHDKDIVDGQQRVTTLSLIRRALQDNHNITYNDNCELKFNHTLSFQHLRENYNFIKSWLSKINNCSGIAEYLDTHCEYVVLQITGKDSLSMAFKLFDSQNGRGKPLEAYNLLKAFHLRAMENMPSEDKIDCDRNWEKATRYSISQNTNQTYDILKHLFDEQLYRSRVWSRNRSAWSFGKKQIGEFKGMLIDKFNNPKYPFQNQQLLLYMTEKFYQSFLQGTMPTCTRFSDNDDISINPFTSISQPIVNGKDFFTYIQTYTQLYKRLFIELDTYQLREFKKFYKKYCLQYDGHWRRGDNYVREMYKSLILYLFDKFGENILNKYYKTLYLLSYVVRRTNGKVFYQTVAKHPQEIFTIIAHAKSEYDLKRLNDKIQWEIKNGYDFPLYEDVINQIK